MPAISTCFADAAARPLAAHAQQAAIPMIGYLSSQSADDDYKDHTVPFLQSLKETGYVAGQNAAVEYRWADNQTDPLPALAAELVRRRIAVIVAAGTPAALAAKAATSTIPTIFATGADPVALGLVASLNRPVANLTGIANLQGELAPKQLQLLRELILNAPRSAFLRTLAFRIPNPPSQTCRRRHAGWVCKSLLCMPEPMAISKRPSQLFRNSALVRSWSASVPSTPGERNNLPHWRPATGCPRSTHTVSTP
jgi:hypothetical protein